MIFFTLDGSKHSLRDFSGQWVVVNFWAEWCAPCLKEIPELNKLADSSSSPNIRVFGISYDQFSNQVLSEKVDKLGINYPVLATEPNPILPFSLPPTLPTNYIIAPDGNVALKLVGEQSYSSLMAAIEKAQQQYTK